MKNKTIKHSLQAIVSGGSYAFRSANAARRAQRRQCGNDRTIALELGCETVYVGAGQLWLVDGKQVHLVIGRCGQLVRMDDVTAAYI